ncbi:MAG: MATE family efflux transporter [Solobacterium sp.]|nr:MATE family efflux transporter [Solobacterium sp.]
MAGKRQNDFGTGRMWKVILSQSIPLMFAQLVHLLYNVVDRIYIGHLPDIGSMALTGVGLAFPITALVGAFTNLFATGGAPLFAIARGEGDEDKAERVLGQAAGMLTGTSVVLFVIGLLFRRPILYLFGASDASYVFADQYLKFYIFGTTAAMLSTGLNGFINASGYPKVGMMTIFIGAALNLVLDPLFIYGLHMGVSGAAIATVISQVVSAFWAVSFFLRREAVYHIRKEYMIPDFPLLKQIIPLGIAGFVMQGTNALVQIMCNVMLRQYGSDLYVGIMTILNSIREILSLPASALSQGTQPVLSYNFGAKQHSRVKEGIRFLTASAGIYTAAALAAVLLLPQMLIGIFTTDAEMIRLGADACRLYFIGFIFMTMQLAGQAVFTSLRCSKRAIFFSIFRKVIIVVPLTVLLPAMGLGVNGVFAAEPVSNLIGGMACFTAMYFTAYRKLPADGETAHI